MGQRLSRDPVVTCAYDGKATLGVDADTVGIWAVTVGRLRFSKPKDRWDVLLMGFLALFAVILLLTWIGIGAGVK